MTTIRRRRDRTFTTVPLDLFEDARLSLPAIGLYCWLADETRIAEEAMVRFGINRAQLTMLVVQLNEAGFIELEGAGS
ncbi:hypothetical protein R1A27_04755 [Methylobacterium sp. NMS12]|uniref:hypothetical protein n=1 Tax=Methylobacterium sp. NMS12 TaxID=3079766 RepID=UPI003F884D99